MRSSPVLPIEFRVSCSRPPDRLYAAEISGAFGTAVIAGTENGLVAATVETPLPCFAGRIEDDWGVRVLFDDGPFGAVLDDFRAYLDGGAVTIHAIVQPVNLPPFVIAIHEAITQIPYGETVTYGEVAIMAGYPGAARAAGNACARNRVLLAVPCHRVVASGGIGGFGGNVPLKRRLLEHEGIDRFTQ